MSENYLKKVQRFDNLDNNLKLSINIDCVRIS